MEYTDRKICGLINLHSMTPILRCPQLFDSNASKNSACDGWELFETYLRFKDRSMELKDNHKP